MAKRKLKRRSAYLGRLGIFVIFIGILLGIIISTSLYATLATILGSEFNLPIAIIGGTIFGTLFGLINYEATLYLTKTNSAFRISMKLFILNFVAIFLLSAYWFIPLPNLGYMFTLATIVSLLVFGVSYIVQTRYLIHDSY